MTDATAQTTPGGRAAGILFVRPKTEPRCFGPAIDSLKKNRPVQILSSLDEIAPILTARWFGLIVTCCQTTQELTALLVFLKQNLPRIKSAQIRVLVFNGIPNDKVPPALQSKGCSETVDYNLAERTFLFKIEKHFKFIRSAEGLSDHHSRPSITEAPIEFKQSIVFSEPISGNFDYWWVRKKSDIRLIGDTWAIDLIGPSPNVAAWEKNPAPSGVTVSGLTWRWKVKSPESVFFLSDGEWAFFGEKPEFIWSENRWRLYSKMPALGFFRNSTPVAFRFRLNANGILRVAENSVHAQACHPAILESFNSEISIAGARPTTAIGADFFQADEAEEQLAAQDYVEKLSQGTDAFLPVGIEEGSSEQGAAKMLAQSPSSVAVEFEDDPSVGQSVSIDFKTPGLGDGSPITLSGTAIQVAKAEENSVTTIELDEKSKKQLLIFQKAIASKQDEATLFLERAQGIRSVVSTLPQREKIFLEFFSNHSILVVDPDSASAQVMVDELAKLGANRDQIRVTTSVQSARVQIKASPVSIVFAEYWVGQDLGAQLSAEFKSGASSATISPNSSPKIFVVTSASVSQAALSRAAEEEADGYLVKPFQPEHFAQLLKNIVLNHLRPSDYIRGIRTGQSALSEKKYAAAIREFEAAQALDPKPSLACYYLGKAQHEQRNYSRAEAQYREGLSYQMIHFKCLNGMVKLLLEMRRHHEAYETIRKMLDFYPTHPERLSQGIRLLVENRKFDEMQYFEGIFRGTEPKTETTVRHMCAALAVTGHYHLRLKQLPAALESLNRAWYLTQNKPAFIRYAIESLERYGYKDAARSFFERLHD